MFSPSQLIQSLVQRAPVSAQKPVELTPGQVFKGTVIRQYPDNMALVQIGGMQVQAKLEAKLEQGQKAWLQVQPSADVVTLKVLDTPVEGPGKEATMEGLIRSLGLPETKESKTIVTALMNAHLPVTKETVQAFTTVATRLGTDDAAVEAFMMAVKRNLPLTPDTVAGLRAFLADKPISQVIQNFLQQAAQFLEAPQSNPTAREGQAGQADGALRQLVALLKEKVSALPLANPAEAEQPLPSAANTSYRSSPAGQNGQVIARTGEGATGTSGTVPQAATLPQNGPSAPSVTEPSQQAAQATAGKQNDPAPLLQAATNRPGQAESQSQASVAPQSAAVPPSTGNQGVNHLPAVLPSGQADENISSPRTANQPIASSAIGQQAGELPKAGQPSEQANRSTIQLGTPAVQVPNAGSATSSPATNPIQELFRQMGIAHERELMGQTLSAAASDDRGVHRQMETVKSMLLQLAQATAHTVPASLRDAADQLLQQVTGQQLMMVQPTNHALSQIVMQIPIRSAQGEETAYVQIESRKKGGGQVDAENCRLFFHLDLQQMGTTMIDVSIVNRIVNLQIFNDRPWVEELVQGMKASVAGQLQEVGYQLSAVRVQSIPKQQPATSAGIGAMLTDYKGVDLRV